MYTAAYTRAQPPDTTGHRGRIVLAGSTASLYPFPNESLYGASKHGEPHPMHRPAYFLPTSQLTASIFLLMNIAGVLGLPRSLAVPLLAEGITINALAPSLIATGIVGDPHAFDALKADNCLTPMSTVMRAVSIFVGEQAQEDEYITGHSPSLLHISRPWMLTCACASPRHSPSHFLSVGQIIECTLDTLSFRTQPCIQNADESRCLEKMWPKGEIVQALALPWEIARVNGQAWDEAEVATAGGRSEGVNVVIN